MSRYERIRFLVIALRNNIEVYAWAPKPYHKFMAFKSFCELPHKPMIVDLTVEEGSRLKVGIHLFIQYINMKKLLLKLLSFLAAFVWFGIWISCY